MGGEAAVSTLAVVSRASTGAFLERAGAFLAQVRGGETSCTWGSPERSVGRDRVAGSAVSHG